MVCSFLHSIVAQKYTTIYAQYVDNKWHLHYPLIHADIGL